VSFDTDNTTKSVRYSYKVGMFTLSSETALQNAHCLLSGPTALHYRVEFHFVVVNRSVCVW